MSAHIEINIQDEENIPSKVYNPQTLIGIISATRKLPTIQHRKQRSINSLEVDSIPFQLYIGIWPLYLHISQAKVFKVRHMYNSSQKSLSAKLQQSKRIKGGNSSTVCSMMQCIKSRKGEQYYNSMVLKLCRSQINFKRIS